MIKTKSNIRFIEPESFLCEAIGCNNWARFKHLGLNIRLCQDCLNKITRGLK